MASGGILPASRRLLFADGCAIAAGAFAVLMAPLMVFGITKGPTVFTEAAGSLVLFVLPVGVPILTWLLNRRRITWRAVGGAVLGYVAGSAVIAVIFMGAKPVLALLPRKMPEQGYGMLGYFGVVALLVLAVLIADLVAAVRDLRGSRVDPRLDWWRVASVVATVVFAVAVVIAQLRNINSEVGEAIIFAMGFAILSGFAVLGADMLAGTVAPPPPTPEVEA